MTTLPQENTQYTPQAQCALLEGILVGGSRNLALWDSLSLKGGTEQGQVPSNKHERQEINLEGNLLKFFKIEHITVLPTITGLEDTLNKEVL